MDFRLVVYLMAFVSAMVVSVPIDGGGDVGSEDKKQGSKLLKVDETDGVDKIDEDGEFDKTDDVAEIDEDGEFEKADLALQNAEVNIDDDIGEIDNVDDVDDIAGIDDMKTPLKTLMKTTLKTTMKTPIKTSVKMTLKTTLNTTLTPPMKKPSIKQIADRNSKHNRNMAMDQDRDEDDDFDDDDDYDDDFDDDDDDDFDDSNSGRNSKAQPPTQAPTNPPTNQPTNQPTKPTIDDRQPFFLQDRCKDEDQKKCERWFTGSSAGRLCRNIDQNTKTVYLFGRLEVNCCASCSKFAERPEECPEKIDEAVAQDCREEKRNNGNLCDSEEDAWKCCESCQERLWPRVCAIDVGQSRGNITICYDIDGDKIHH